jgi:O-antigen ligase
MTTTQMQPAPALIEMQLPEQRTRSKQRALLQVLDTALECVLLALLIAAVLSFGGVQSWGVFGIRVGAVLLFLLWTARQIISEELEFPSAFLPLVLFGLWIAAQWAFGITVYRYETGQDWLTYAAYLFLMLPAATIAANPARLHRFLTALAVFGAILAVFAMIQDVSATKAIYWTFEPSGIAAQIYGPFVNRNHYAGLMEMLAPLPFLLCLSHRPERRLPLLGAGLLMALSVFLCRSRGGMAALGAELIFIAVFLSRIRHRAKSFAAIGVIVAVLAVLIVWVGSDPVVHRLTDMKDANRVAIFKDTLHMWWSRPIIGYGSGTFALVYPTFQSFVVDSVINHAHNDYLELLSETGLIGTGLVLWFLALAYRRTSKRLSPGSRSSDSASLIAVLAGISGLLIHSLVDFNFHIPSNAALFLVMCAIAVTASAEETGMNALPRNSARN